MIEAKNGQAKAVSVGEYVAANMARENEDLRRIVPRQGATSVIQLPLGATASALG
jgi:hypothetical protein